MHNFLRTARTFSLVSVLLLAVLCQGCRTYGPSVTASVEIGKDACTVISVPTPWVLDEPAIPPLVRHEIYAWSATGEGFLFTLHGYGRLDDIEKGLEQRYLVSLSHPGDIRLASEAEWQSRKAITEIWGHHELGQLDSPEPRGKLDGSKIYRDDRLLKRYPAFTKSGAIWNWAAIGLSCAMPAPGDRFVALESFDGYYTNGKADWSNNFYIDVYEIATRKKVALIRGKWNDYTPEGVLKEARWISDRVLVFPFGKEKRKLIVCQFRQGQE